MARRHSLIFFFAVLFVLPTGNFLFAREGLDRLIVLQNFQSQRASSSNPDLHSNGDAISIAPGQTVVLAELEGPGIITHIWTTVGSIDPFHGRSLVLRIYWDGAEKPSVQAPLGDFFGVGHGAFASFTSAPVSVSSHGRARNCFWKMPFRKSARITVANESPKYETNSFYYYIDWQKREELPEDVLYFHAEYRQAMPAPPGDYTILETVGRGHYVGTVYSVQQMETGWFGEGDDRFYIDGEAAPSLRGTGTEDYFGDAWGFRQFSRPWFGVSLWEGYFVGDRVSAYRWHIEDPIAFAKSLKVTIEHRGSVFDDASRQLCSSCERPDWISSVAFWYQQPIKKLSPLLPPAEKRIAPYRVLGVDDLKISAEPAGGLSKQKIGVEYMPLTPDAKISFTFNVEQSGRYQINAFITHSLFSSLYQPFLDGQPLGGVMDLCSSGSDPLWTSFDLHDLQAGEHTLSFEGRGPSPARRSLAPPVYAFSLQYIILLRLQDMQGYHAVVEGAAKK